MAGQFLTVKRAAARLDVSPMTVYRLIYAGALTGHYIGQGSKPRVRVDEAELLEYMDSTADRTHPPSGPQTPSPPPGPRPAPSRRAA